MTHIERKLTLNQLNKLSYEDDVFANIQEQVESIRETSQVPEYNEGQTPNHDVINEEAQA